MVDKTDTIVKIDASGIYYRELNASLEIDRALRITLDL